MIRYPALAAALLLCAAPALAGTELKLEHFSRINVHGGGDVKISYGPVQRVTVIESDPKVARVEVHGDTLDLSPCTGMCWGNHPLKVEVVVPTLEGVEVHGGGSLVANGHFPTVPRLNIEIHGGGSANLRGLPADDVMANVHGGGTAHINAQKSLTAEVHGGGEITYVGHPPVINSQTHGGGSIHGE